MTMLRRYVWADLNHLQVGRYAEYLVEMEIAMFGFENNNEVDDRCI